MPVLLATYDLLVRHPVKLNHPSLAGERLVAVPGVVAPLKNQESSCQRRQFDHHIIQITFRSQQSQPAAGLIPQLDRTEEGVLAQRDPAPDRS